jgi:hypothetical protein
VMWCMPLPAVLKPLFSPAASNMALKPTCRIGASLLIRWYADGQGDLSKVFGRLA